MKKLFLLFISIFFIFNFSYIQATEFKIVSKQEAEELNRELTIQEIFSYFGNYVGDYIPESYKYIELKFRGVKKDSSLYDALQKLVYLNIIKNKSIYLKKDKKMSALTFYKLAERVYGTKIILPKSEEILKKTFARKIDFENLKSYTKEKKYNFDIGEKGTKLYQKKIIFSDVYKTLKTAHYNSANIKEEEMIDSAIEGLAKGTKDKFTVYFPPADNKNFKEGLTGKYEGIGAYVDMENAGELTIVAPISGSPAEKAGLKGGDIVIAVDGKEIKKNNSLQEVVSWIKGPAGTKVVLTVKRGKKILDVEIKRAKIVIKDVEYEVLDGNTFYIKLKFYGPTTFIDFKKALKELKENKRIKKVIIDLRNNPGGYLDQVTKILSFFIPKGEPTAIVKYKNGNMVYKSKGYDLVDFSKYKLIILQNSGTASASEIMIGTIKDYFPKTILIGENSYGKGSVQTIKTYSDGSSLKYTIAKWFTGKTETGIDGIGIKPDIEIKMDDYVFSKQDDKQLKKARLLR